MKLQDFLIKNNVANTGAHSRRLIVQGCIWVNGEPDGNVNRELINGDKIEISHKIAEKNGCAESFVFVELDVSLENS
jgi:ribosome-associated protein YbcJ (S4-like RNA binding protein)